MHDENTYGFQTKKSYKIEVEGSGLYPSPVLVIFARTAFQASPAVA